VSDSERRSIVGEACEFECGSDVQASRVPETMPNKTHTARVRLARRLAALRRSPRYDKSVRVGCAVVAGRGSAVPSVSASIQSVNLGEMNLTSSGPPSLAGRRTRPRTRP
jgi:hypothetical protein